MEPEREKKEMPPCGEELYDEFLDVVKHGQREPDDLLTYFEPEWYKSKEPEFIEILAAKVRGILESDLTTERRVEQLVSLVILERASIATKAGRPEVKD